MNFVNNIENRFSNIFDDFSYVDKIYYSMLNDFIRDKKLRYFDENMFIYTQEKIKLLEEEIGEEKFKKVLVDNFDLFIDSYEELINMVKLSKRRLKVSYSYNDNMTISINAYNTLHNKIFNNLFKLFIEFYNIVTEKNISQRNLTSQVEFLTKKGYSNLVEDINPNIRNSISHGSYEIKKNQLEFRYKKGPSLKIKTMSSVGFESHLDKLINSASGIILAWIAHIAKRRMHLDYDNLTISATKFFDKLILSDFEIKCTYIDILNIRGNKRINIDFFGIDLSEFNRYKFGIAAAQKIYRLKNLSKNDSIMLDFKAPRTVESFFVIDGNIIEAINNKSLDIEEAIIRIKTELVSLDFEPNDDKNASDEETHTYKDIESQSFAIEDIEDISRPKSKRFKAKVFLNEASEFRDVKVKIKKIVKELKSIPNYGFSKEKVKYGDMEADVILLTIYKNNFENKSLSSSNDNFIAQAQYSQEKLFPIQFPILNKTLKTSYEDNIEYKWNSNFLSNSKKC